MMSLLTAEIFAFGLVKALRALRNPEAAADEMARRLATGAAGPLDVA